MAYAGPAAGFCLTAAMFVCGATGLPVPPAQAPPTSGVLTLGASGSTSYAPGATVSLSGNGFAGNARVTVAMYSSPQVLTNTVADASGHVTATVTLPTNLRGEHTIIALGNNPSNAGRSLESVVDIETTPVQTATGLPQALAFTGFNVAAWILAAIGMLIAGFALIRTAVFRRKFVPAVAGNTGRHRSLKTSERAGDDTPDLRQ
jgi:hypothetical protein